MTQLSCSYEITVPYVKKEHQSEVLGEEQKALVIMDIFTGEKTSEVKEVLQVNNILVTNLPHITRFYQPLDLTINERAKTFISKKIIGWYLQQVCSELESGK